MIFCAEPHSATDSVQISAAPPRCSMSCLVCWAGVAEQPFAGQRGADVVDDDLGAGRGHGERDLAADAAARSGDDRDLAFHHARHRALLWCPASPTGE